MACRWVVPKKTKDLMALIPDISERTARDWLNELKTAESLIRNIIRESADF
jgi:DNA-binding HxlR family transcriptional regulator